MTSNRHIKEHVKSKKLAGNLVYFFLMGLCMRLLSVCQYVFFVHNNELKVLRIKYGVLVIIFLHLIFSILTNPPK